MNEQRTAKLTQYDILPLFTQVLSMEGNGILRCVERLNSSNSSRQSLFEIIELFCETLDNGGKIIVTGIGKSGKIAQKISATFSSTGTASVFLHPTEALHGDLGLATDLDCVLALSYTGNTDELIRLVPPLKSRGIPIVGLGGNSRSALSEICTHWLDGFVEQEACPNNLTPTASTTLALAIGDALAITLMQVRGFNAEGFARNHPGGALGKRLNLKVQALMHSGDQLPVVSPSASMDEVVLAITQKKMGAVLVLNGSKLLGIITDGDLRRALKHREKFFTLMAKDIMTSQPARARSSMMAKEALELMENRPSQISVLPVIDDTNNCVGIIRLHDIVKTI